MFNYHIESYTFVIADELKNLLENKKEITNSLFETTKEFINSITQFDKAENYRYKDPHIDRKLIIFDFSGLYEVCEEYDIRVERLVKELFYSLIDYFGYFICIKIFRFEPNYDTLSSDRIWVLRYYAESMMIRYIRNSEDVLSKI